MNKYSNQKFESAYAYLEANPQRSTEVQAFLSTPPNERTFSQALKAFGPVKANELFRKGKVRMDPIPNFDRALAPQQNHHTQPSPRDWAPTSNPLEALPPTENPPHRWATDEKTSAEISSPTSSVGYSNSHVGTPQSQQTGSSGKSTKQNPATSFAFLRDRVRWGGKGVSSDPKSDRIGSDLKELGRKIASHAREQTRNPSGRPMSAEGPRAPQNTPDPTPVNSPRYAERYELDSPFRPGTTVEVFAYDAKLNYAKGSKLDKLLDMAERGVQKYFGNKRQPENSSNIGSL